MRTETLGIAHPGAMGAAVGTVAVASGARVCWASAGRSAATRRRADDAGLDDLGDLETLAAKADVLFAVCPPEVAEDLARTVAATGFGGVYVDANAIAPTTAGRIGTLIGGRAAFVDGGIVGPPPATGRSRTRLFLSGREAPRVAEVFEGTALATVVLEGPAGAASALKACYAAYTKGTSALLATIRALARHHGVEEALLDEWARSLPDLPERSVADMRRAAPKAWRFTGEMREIAATMRDAELPAGVPEAAAEVYGRLAGFKDADPPPGIEEILDALGASDAERGP